MMELKPTIIQEYMESFNSYLKDVISNERYHYSISAGFSIKAQALTPSGEIRFRGSEALQFTVGNLLYFKHDLDHECSFIIDEKPSKKNLNYKFSFTNIDDIHTKKAFLLFMQHLKQINVGNDINKKRNPFYCNINLFEICPVYVFDSKKQQVYQKIIFKFKRHEMMDELYVIVKNTDESFIEAMKIVDNEFYKRYYSKVIEKKDMTETLTKSEKQIVKMYYY